MDWIDALAGVSDVVSSNWPPQKPKQLWTPGKPSIDIVIPHRGDKILTSLGQQKLSVPMSAGLVMTLATCEDALRETNLNYKYFVVANGVADSGPEREALNGASEFLDKTGRGTVIKTPASSPPAARNVGAAVGNGDLIFFFDNHCYVDKNYFARAVETFESRNADAVHGVTVYGDKNGDKNLYHHKLFLEEWFLGYPASAPDFSCFVGAMLHAVFSKDRHCAAYRIAAALHGSLAVKRTTWNEVGGYWDGFVGFGGEEIYFDLKLNMMGKSVWLDPSMKHEHFLGGQKNYKVWPEFAENVIATAYILGGQSWAEKIATSYHAKNVLEGGEDKAYWDAMLSRAIERSADHAKWFASKRLRTLDEQLEKFKAEHVAM